MLPIDPSQLPQDVTANLLASGLVWLMTYTPGALGFGNADDDSRKADDLITEALNDLTYNYEWEHEQIRFEEVGNFLATQESQMLMRQLYSYTMITDELREEADISSQQICDNFVQTMAHYFDVSPDEIEDSATTLYDDFIQRVETILQNAIESGLLVAVDVRAMRRHHVLMDELQAIKKMLRFHAEKRVVSLEEINRFEEKYREQVASEEGRIQPLPYRGRRPRIKIDEIYVLPNFTSARDTHPAQKKIIFDEMTNHIYRQVLLGDPGAGKSTFTKKLTYDLSKSQNPRLIGGRRLTPILIVLRKFSQRYKKTACSILDYIVEKSNSDYQIAPPEGAVEYLLLKGRALVIFDGLDELLETTQRQDMTRRIEFFCNLYPAVPVVVTSRKVGYQQAPLNREKFKVFELALFNGEQIKEYSENWFTHHPEIRNAERKNLIESFLKDLELVPDEVKQSPLLLSPLCGMHYSSGYLPRNRPEIYEKCSKMLFRDWDTMRDIQVELPFEKQVRPTMRYLANWIYRDSDLQEGVTERQLIHKTQQYLFERSYTNKDEARAAAEKFVEFCKGRAWVFTDLGTDAEGRPLYQFTHQTFLEYFTAEYLTQTIRTPEELLDELFPRIRSEEWSVVCELAFQLQAEKQQDDGDLLIFNLLERIEMLEVDPEDRLRCISFALQCASFLALSPRTLKKLSSFCMFVFAEQHELINIDPVYKTTFKLNFLGKSSLHLHRDNVINFNNFLLNFIINIPEKNINSYRKIICELSLMISPDESSTGILGLVRPIRNFWQPVSRGVTQHYQSYFPLWMVESKKIALDFFVNHKISLGKIVQLHGLEILFHGRSSALFGFTSSPITVDTLLNFARKPRESVFIIPVDILVKEYFPIKLSRDNDSYFIGGSDLIEKQEESEEKISTEVWFTIFFLSAVYLNFATFYANFSKLKNLTPLKHTLLARSNSADHIDHVQAELDAIGFDEEQQEFIWQWVQGNIDFMKIVDS